MGGASSFVGKVGNMFGAGTGYNAASGQLNPYQQYQAKNVNSQKVNSQGLQNAIGTQANQQKASNVNNFNAAVGSQRNINPALASMMMGNNLAQANTAASQQAATLQAQTDFQGQMFNAQNQTQTDMFNSQQAQAAHGMNQQSYYNAQGINTGISENQANRSQQTIGGLLSGGSAALALMSDERIKDGKKKLKSDDEAIEEFLESLTPHKFKYKEGSEGDDGGKKHMGVMAQKIEKTEAGEGMVSENSNGTKQLDVSQLTGSLAAGLGAIYKRLKILESKGVA